MVPQLWALDLNIMHSPFGGGASGPFCLCGDRSDQLKLCLLQASRAQTFTLLACCCLPSQPLVCFLCLLPQFHSATSG